MKKAVIFILSAALLASFCGCSNRNSSPDDTASDTPKFSETNITLTENGQSDYKIVLPLLYSYTEGYAAQELQEILYDATGCKLSIISDSGLSADNAGHYLSVGNTSLLKAQTDIKVSYDTQGESGVQVQTKGNTVYMIGATDRGTLNSVYQFLYYQVGFQTYAYDETYVDYDPSLKVLNFDYVYKPTIEWTLAIEKKVSLDEKTASRMYTYGDSSVAGSGYSGGGMELDGSPLFSLWCHDSTGLVSEAAHPEFWNNGQFCLTNEEGYEAFSAALIERVSSSNSSLVMLGPADVGSVCNCDGCKAAAEQYGGYGGVYMRFANRLAEDLENYFTEQEIDRRICLSILAYQGYSKSPTVTGEDGKILPVDESVVAKKDGNVTVGVCYTPITACYTHAFGDGTCETNKIITENLRGWSSLTDNMFMYTYGTNFSYLTFPYNNWQFMADTFKFYEENNVRFLFDQSDSWNGVGPMSEMRSYVRSKLAWDADLNAEELIGDFMQTYYGPGAADVKTYFNTLQTHFQTIYTKAGTSDQDCYYAIGTQTFWPRSVILELESILSSAMSAIEKSGLDADKKALYHDRVEREYIIWKVNELTLYESSLSGAELSELQKTVAAGRAKYDINRRSEHVID